MLTFLRKIRWSLIESNSAHKYLVYAIGEIALVVIGILIALQINTWNEFRKDRKTEQSLYLNLIEVLESDLSEIERLMDFVDNGIKAQEAIIKSSVTDIVQNQSKEQIIDLLNRLNQSGYSFFPNYGLYNQITSNNQIDLIRSTNLRLKIIELYDRSYKRYEHIDRTLEEKHQFHVWPVISSKIGVVQFGDEILTYEIWKMDDFERHYANLRESCRDFYTITRDAHFTLAECKSQIMEILDLINTQIS